jgi:hypothetical protein
LQSFRRVVVHPAHKLFVDDEMKKKDPILYLVNEVILVINNVSYGIILSRRVENRRKEME